MGLFSKISDSLGDLGHSVSNFVSHPADSLTTLVGNPFGNMAFTTPDSQIGQLSAIASIPYLAGPGAGFSGAGLAPGESGGTPLGLPGFGGGGDPLSTLMSFGSGFFGLRRAKKQDDLAREMLNRSDPFGPQRAQFAQRLNELYADPSQVERLPGYKAGLDAVERKMASQGYLGSGNMMLALHDYGGRMFDNEAARLATLAGGRMSPDTGTFAKMTSDNTDLYGKSLASLGFGGKSLSSLFSGGGALDINKLFALLGSGGGGTSEADLLAAGMRAL